MLGLTFSDFLKASGLLFKVLSVPLEDLWCHDVDNTLFVVTIHCEGNRC